MRHTTDGYDLFAEKLVGFIFSVRRSCGSCIETAPCVDFHHRLTAYPSYKQDAADFPPHLLYYRFFLRLPDRSAANPAADTKRRIPQIASVKESPVAGAGSAASLLSSTNRSVLFPFSLGPACTCLLYTSPSPRD